MKALCFEQTGEPSEVLQLKEIEKPGPGPGEVRLKLVGSPINPADEMFIKGQYRLKPVFPDVAGLEGAGIIDAVGENVDLPVGIKASFFAKRAWAEYLVIPASDLFVLPHNLPDEKAVQSFLNPVTSWGLLEQIGVKENDWLLLTAGNSSVSRIVTQISAKRGIKVILVVRNSENSGELKSLGAMEVIDGSTEDISKRVLEITGGKGVDGILDSVGGKTGTEILKSVAVNARIIVYGILSRDMVEFHNSVFLYRNVTTKGFGIRGYLESRTREQKEAMFTALAQILGNKNFKLDVSALYPFREYREAFAALHESRRRGKIILKP